MSATSTPTTTSDAVEVGRPGKSAAGVPAVLVSLQRSLEQMGPVRTVSTWRGSTSATASTAPAARGRRSTAAASSPSSARTAPRPSPRRPPAGSSTPEFFARHSVAELAAAPEYWLSQQGRLTHPMVLRPGDDHYRPIGWDDAYRLIAEHLQRAGQPGRGGVLHLRAHQQRGGVPLPAAGPQLRHQQPAGLLQHVPRVLRHRADRVDRHRQGLGDRRGPRPRRPDRHRRAEPRHQPSPDAVGAGEGEGQRREDHRGQPAARGRADPVQGSAEGARRGRPRRADRRRVRADPPRRRHGPVRAAWRGCCWRPTTGHPAPSSTASSSPQHCAGFDAYAAAARAVDLDTVLAATGIDRPRNCDRVARDDGRVRSAPSSAGRWA